MSTNDPTIASDLLPVADSAAYLGVSPRTLETLIVNGLIPVAPIAPKARRIRRSDLDTYIERVTTTATAISTPRKSA